MKDVHITDNNGHVNPNDVDISRKLGEQVVWFADQGATTIEFSRTECPFDRWSFNVAAGGSVPSGPAKGGAELKRYKYTVTGPTGQNDAGVIIQN